METRNQYSSLTNVCWIVTLLGCALWTYGYFLGGSGSLLNRPSFSPTWVADYLPNWQSETGLLLTLVASLPIYYAQIMTSRRED